MLVWRTKKVRRESGKEGVSSRERLRTAPATRIPHSFIYSFPGSKKRKYSGLYGLPCNCLIGDPLRSVWFIEETYFSFFLDSMDKDLLTGKVFLAG